MYDVELRSLFEGDHGSHIYFPFNTEQEAREFVMKKFKNHDGWELDEDKYYKGKFYYDWMGNPSYEVRIRRA